MRLALAFALAGCFGKPGFSGRDAATGDAAADVGPDTPMACSPSRPSAPGLGVATASTDTHVAFLDGSQVGFRSALSRYPLPDRLIVGGQNLVASPEGCAFEDQVGLAAYPVFSVGAQALTGNPTHALDVEVQGPALTSLRTSWSLVLPSACSAAQTQATGNTSWTFFPDGKVVRNDTITPAETSDLMTGGGCNCPGAVGAGTFLVTSYTTLEASLLSAVTRPGQAEQQALPPQGVIGGAPGACARGTSGGKVAVWWDRLDNQDPATPPTRLRHEANMGNAHDIVAFVYDMVSDASPVSTIAAGTSYGIRTHMMLNAGGLPCTDLLTRLEAFASTQPLTISPVGMPGGGQVAYSALGVFDDATSYTGPVTITGALAPGFAVSLRFPGFTAVATDRAADRVVWQRSSDGTFTLFFLDDLGAGAPITVTPECPS